MTTANFEIASLLVPESIQLHVGAEDKWAAIDRTLKGIQGRREVQSFETVKKDIIERERKMSTGVGRGVALPHASTAGVTGPIGAFSLLDPPVPFDAVDERPARFLFLLAVPKARAQRRMRLLKHIARVLRYRPVLEHLLHCRDPTDVLQLFTSAEARLREHG